MSFKRDGDNKDLFGITMKRRVGELLSEDISEEDAFLMKNGKLACTVCRHRPVFDTINMLAIHRKGKRHMESEERRQKDREEVTVLALKRNQLHLLQSEDKAHAQLGGQWKKAKPYDRKKRLDVVSNSLIAKAASTETTPSTSLPGLCPSAEPAAGTSRPGKECQARQQQASGHHWPFAPHPDVHASDRMVPQEQCVSKASSQAATQRYPAPGTSASGSRSQLAQKYLQARGAGWKKDLLGNWVKDEDAEFDSDEEPPALP